jgi:hypothetical protein
MSLYFLYVRCSGALMSPYSVCCTEAAAAATVAMRNNVYRIYFRELYM